MTTMQLSPMRCLISWMVLGLAGVYGRHIDHLSARAWPEED